MNDYGTFHYEANSLRRGRRNQECVLNGRVKSLNFHNNDDNSDTFFAAVLFPYLLDKITRSLKISAKCRPNLGLSQRSSKAIGEFCMKQKWNFRVGNHPTWLGLLLALAAISQAFGLETVFTYQGRLNQSGNPVAGVYDLAFCLYSTNTSGTPLGAGITNSAVHVTNGVFTTSLDFGANVFDGTDLWLEISVRTNGAGTFTTLAPRQQLTAVPCAIFASNAGSAQGVANGANITNIQAANIVGQLPAASLPGASLFSAGATATNDYAYALALQTAVQRPITHPPKGVDFWHTPYAGQVTESVVLQQAQWLATYYLTYGWNFMQLDDLCWTNRDDNGNLVPIPSHFPDGMTYLVSAVHALGVKIGCYTEPNPFTSAGGIGSYGHLEQDARQFANWGFDYVKFDYPGSEPIATKIYTAQRFAAAWFAANTNRQVWIQFDGYSSSGTGAADFPKELAWIGSRMRSMTDMGNAYGGGVYQEWHQLLDYFDGYEEMKQLISPGHYLDSEFAMLGWQAPCCVATNTLPQIESYSALAMDALYHTSLYGGNLTRLGDYPDRDIFTTNTLWLSVADDSACLTPRIVSSNLVETFVEPLVSGDVAFVLLNRDTNSAHTASINSTDLGLNGSLNATEVWSGTAALAGWTGVFKTNLPPMGSFFGIASSAAASTSGVTSNVAVGRVTFYITNGIIKRISSP